ncbi:MAG: hypothetical protein EAZ09_20160 [Oscillatoriales cyanobacterium]|uniref:hypothetical protein n=1 Tax=unclassified Microcoleus TaxID=2642155 RepID=UPI001DB012FD|nr:MULTISPECIES: hypothetical protein [unclassified Microcoleus]TAG90089.1 MAG: hypothetical protein EAZ18_19605 [Oscillatoriales cyanobacterium]MCC3568577.1 hypothetical protein [Microcoleus sp. PH2017_31_RDM_U_A]MCC3580853.1 hypothetical protein [Microcoleus sp. PH2017_32_RDM_D_A]MCC3618962.1 hypothetical protein [Microcoleus sp. PH2017_38_RDM_U_B]TAH17189.1 MAG: hypothetical protein EAZ09_20160 [Oscillatoriales cyanobacterium]
MNYLPPGNSNPNQPDQTGYDSLTEKMQLNDQVRSWKTWIDGFKNEHRTCFEWLLKIFYVSNHAAQQQQVNSLINAIENPETFLQTFREIYENFLQLQNENRSLKKNNYSFSGNNHYLSQENKRLNDEVYRLQQENRRTAQLQAKIEELERENQELHGRVSSLMGKLSDRDRDKASTLTSDESRRQRDVLTQDFTHLNTQDFNAASSQIFNHRCEAKPDLKANRKLEIASIKSIFSKRILKGGNEFFVSNKLIQPEDFPKTTEWFTDLLLKDLEMPMRANCPEAILKSLENLVEKGLRLVKDIVNDEPPGELLIDDEGSVFNPERHQPVPGCEPSGMILYTTYPGYCINNRILVEALKAFVFTVPEAEFNPVTTSNIASKDVASKNDSANISGDIESKQLVESNCSVDETVSGSQKQETENLSSVIQKLEALEKEKFSDLDIAKRLEVSAQTVYNWKTGKQNPLKENVEKIDRLYKEVCESNRPQ